MTDQPYTTPPTGSWAIVAPVKGKIVGAIALSVISAIAAIAALLAIPPIATELLSTSPDLDQIWVWVAMSAIAVVISFTTKVFAFSTSHLAAFNLEVILRTTLTEHLAKVPLGYITTIGSGAIKKIVQDDVKSLHAFVADSTPLIGRAYTTPVVSLIAMFVADWRLGFVTLAVLPVGMIFIQLALHDYAEKREEYDRANEQINQVVVEFVQGMQVVRTFDDGSSSFARFQRSLDRFTQITREWNEATQTSGRLGTLLFEPLPTLTIVSIVGAWLMLQGTLEFPRLLVFLLLSPRLCGAFKPIFTLSYFINQSNAGAKRIGVVLAEPILPQPGRPKYPQDASVQIKDVSFSYGVREASPQESRPALHRVSIDIPAESVTALVGPSGAGKTTLARLIPRFWDVSNGAIEIGGVDVRDMTSETLMSWVSFVFQDTFLLYDTIRNNIKLGRPNATDAEVEAAAQVAQAHEFILELPDGYDTIAGERGTRLSGGQRQRITIARAILQDNPIIVLDEATAFADPENEALIQQAIASLTTGKTVIVIAHRLPTIRSADQIVVLDQGNVVESGKHDELVSANGLYANLWKRHEEAQNWQLRTRSVEIRNFAPL
ncbi:ABC transporter ATP-binding protein [Myxacorys almedinensis]|uniref:ATP-binding cassette domain-containing protein n=1 Tax=Myxacorys almedinensis A TaxID=2690445 RepID=A0A8J7ZD29_9CYAN|nr:ABC transporter ATP-binding protein [Myxacorys almedinensis]NDJ19830.1 ATP-binding cassette domain-containing protein [Myxacorys almedinensis A]